MLIIFLFFESESVIFIHKYSSILTVWKLHASYSFNVSSEEFSKKCTVDDTDGKFLKSIKQCFFQYASSLDKFVSMSITNGHVKNCDCIYATNFLNALALGKWRLSKEQLWHMLELLSY